MAAVGARAVLVVCDGVTSAPDSDRASLDAAKAARDVLTSAAAGPSGNRGGDLPLERRAARRLRGGQPRGRGRGPGARRPARSPVVHVRRRRGRGRHGPHGERGRLRAGVPVVRRDDVRRRVLLDVRCEAARLARPLHRGADRLDRRRLRQGHRAQPQRGRHGAGGRRRARRARGLRRRDERRRTAIGPAWPRPRRPATCSPSAAGGARRARRRPITHWSAELARGLRGRQPRGRRRRPDARRPAGAAVVHVRRRRRRATAWSPRLVRRLSCLLAARRRRAGASSPSTTRSAPRWSRAGMTRAEAEADPTSHTITRWLGADSVDPTPGGRVASTLAGPGWLVVCSDGLWNHLSDAADAARRSSHAAGSTDPLAVADALVDRANAGGGHDNITAVLARIGDTSDHRHERGPDMADVHRQRLPERVPRRRRHRRARRRVGDLHRGRRGRRRPRRGGRHAHHRHVGLDGHAVGEDQRRPPGRQGRRRRDRRRHVVRRRVGQHDGHDVLPAANRPWCAWTPRPGRAAKRADRRAAARRGHRHRHVADERRRAVQAGAGHAAPRHPADRRQDRGRGAVRPARGPATGARGCSSATAAASARTGVSTSCARSRPPCSARSTSSPSRPTWRPTSRR